MYPQTQLTENPLAPDVKKNTEEFGLKVLRTCYNRWKNGYGGETFIARLARYEKNRLYSAGKQPTEQFRDIVKVDGQIPIVNLDYSSLAIAVPLLNAKVDRYMDRIEKIKCRSTGLVSLNKKKKEKEDARFKMNYRPAIQDLQGKSGLHLEDFSDHDPKSERELDIQFNTRVMKEEIIMQKGIGMVFEQNEWADVIKRRLLIDTFNCGFSVTVTELDGNGWIKTPWVKPEAFITSYSELDDFSDWQWQGQRRSMSISQIRLRWPGKLSEQELWELSQKFIGQYGNLDTWDCPWDDMFMTAVARPYDAFNIEMVDLYYKTLYNLTYEKKVNSFGREILKEATDKSKELEQSKPYYVAYHGVWLIDTDFVMEWGLAKNMLKPNNNLVEVRSPYTVHMYNNNKCRNTPLVETMIPLIDLIQNIHLQTQKIIAMTAPDGFNIDILGLANMDLGEGVGIISPMQAFGIYLQTGNQYFIGKELDGEGEQKPPITPQNHQYSDKLTQLENQWQMTYRKLQAITGDNNLASGQITNQAVANETLNDAREISDNASNYCYRTYLQAYKGTAKNVELLLLDKFFLKDNSFDGYNIALGEEDIEYMRSMGKDIAELIFETKIDVALDSSDQQKWDRRIEIALEQKEITLGDVAELELIDDATYRSFMLAQKAKEKSANDQAIAQANSENNTKQAEAAANAKGMHDMALEKQAHQNKIDQMDKEQDGQLLKQGAEWAGVLKEKLVTAILEKPGSDLKMIPQFIWEGLGIVDETQKQVMFNYLQEIAQKNQPQGPPNPQQAPPPQEQQQAA